MHKFTVPLSDELRQAIRELSAKEGMTSAAYVRALITWVVLESKKAEEALEEPPQLSATPLPDLDKVFPTEPKGLDDFFPQEGK